MKGFKIITNEDKIFDFLTKNNCLKILKKFDSVNTDVIVFFKTINNNCTLIKAACETDSGLILITHKNEKTMTSYALNLVKEMGFEVSKIEYEKL